MLLRSSVKADKLKTCFFLNNTQEGYNLSYASNWFSLYVHADSLQIRAQSFIPCCCAQCVPSPLPPDPGALLCPCPEPPPCLFSLLPLWNGDPFHWCLSYCNKIDRPLVCCAERETVVSGRTLVLGKVNEWSEKWCDIISCWWLDMPPYQWKDDVGGARVHLWSSNTQCNLLCGCTLLRLPTFAHPQLQKSRCSPSPTQPKGPEEPPPATQWSEITQLTQELGEYFPLGHFSGSCFTEIRPSVWIVDVSDFCFLKKILEKLFL